MFPQHGAMSWGAQRDAMGCGAQFSIYSLVLNWATVDDDTGIWRSEGAHTGALTMGSLLDYGG